MITDIITNKYGEAFKKIALKDLKKGDEFKRKPDALKNNDFLGSGIEINAKAYVYVDVDGPTNYGGIL